MKHTFNNEEVAEMRAYMQKVVNEKMGARQTADSDIISNKKPSYCRESAHLTSLCRTMQKAF